MTTIADFTICVENASYTLESVIVIIEVQVYRYRVMEVFEIDEYSYVHYRLINFITSGNFL